VRAEQRIPTLDGVRGTAILLVMLYHMNLLRPASAPAAVDLWFSRAVGVGWCGVDLFFVLSGFLITGILLAAKGRDHFFRDFYARRTLRIFPLYYAVVFVSLVVIPNLPEGIVPAQKLDRFGRIEGDEAWYWLYLSNFAIARAGAWRHGILDISWSLAIEEQFYLLWPALVAFCSTRGLTRFCVALVVLAPCLRLALRLAGAEPMVAYVITPARVDLLAIGALIAIAARSPEGLERFAHPARRAFWAALVLLLADWLVLGFDPFAIRVQVAGYSLLGVVFGGLLVAVLRAPQGSLLARCFESRPLRVLGKYSYALYLFHRRSAHCCGIRSTSRRASPAWAIR
jgi:peptidoglycan/LPS O-acetylase OafA/YrhL